MTTDLTFGSAKWSCNKNGDAYMIVILDDLLLEYSEFFNVTLTTTDPSVTLEPDS